MINQEQIEKAVYDLCVEANTKLPDDVLKIIYDAYETEQNVDAKQVLALILQNAQLAYEKKMPLCQDTGQVLVFVKGKNFPEKLYEAINNGVARAYEENYFRKSIVNDALFDRTNTKTNTPCVIYTEIYDIEGLEIEVLLKGGGSENVCVAQMLSPTATEDEIINYVVESVKKAGSKACPPYFLGIGIGGTLEYAGLLSKKAFLLDKNVDEQHENFAKNVQTAVNKLQIGPAGLGGASTVLDVKILTDSTHIACMPVAVTINCHSMRHGKVLLDKDGNVINEIKKSGNGFTVLPQSDFDDYLKVSTSDIKTLKTLKKGQKVLLSGEIYTARDMAHKRISQMIKNGEKLPFDLKEKIIFYAGPCPCKDDCVVGSVGPTTSARMDKFVEQFYKNGLLATIGKGERSADAKKAIEQNSGLYFTTFGGVACLLSEKFIKKELIAFEDLGPEAIYRFEVNDLPLVVNIGF